MEQGRAPPTQTSRTMVQERPKPRKTLRNRTSTELEITYNKYGSTMAIKFADTYFNYGDTVRSAPIPGPTRGRETSASGLAEGLGRGCRLIVDAHLFFFFSFSLFCFYMHVLVPKIYPTCIENLAVWVCIVMYLVHKLHTE